MKANYREEFLAASMTLDMGNTDKLAMFAGEARKSNIALLPPCVNESGVDFGARAPKEGEKGGAIRYSLAALKNIGASAVETIAKEREAKGPYGSLADFAGRLDPKALNKRGIETLAKAGAFDTLEPNRAVVVANADTILNEANAKAQDADVGQTSFFGEMTSSAGGARATLKLKPAQSWTPMERLAAEFEAVGFYLSGHPLDSYQLVLDKLGVKKFTDFEALTARGATAGRLAGIVVSARERKSQKGNKFAFAMFSDTTGQFEAVVFSDTLAAARDLLEPGTPVIVSVEAERDGEMLKMRAQSIEALEKAAAAVPRNVRVVVDEKAACGSKLIPALRGLMKPAGRGGEIRLVMTLEDRAREVEMVLPGRYEISPQTLSKIGVLDGVNEVIET